LTLQKSILPQDLEEKNMELIFNFLDAQLSKTRKGLSQYVMTKVHSYKSGSSFGELALRNEKPRAASIITTSESHFATLSRADFNKCLAKFD